MSTLEWTALFCGFTVMANLAILGGVLKLYTEFAKERFKDKA